MFGVKVYVVVVVLSSAGVQLPVKPLLEVVGRTVMGSPLQAAPKGVKVGTAFGVTVIVNVVKVAHWPPLGVKV
jgi:hypothetical protein